MILKLHVKVLLLFIAVIIFFATSMLFLVSTSNTKFEKYIRIKEVEKLTDLADTLGVYYVKNSGWGALVENKSLWRQLVIEELVRINTELAPQLDMEQTESIISVVNEFEIIPNPGWDQLGLGPRICLFDENKEFIVGLNKPHITECTLLRIGWEEKTIGWLGLMKSKMVYQPLEQMFLHNQSILFYTIGIFFILILVSIAMLFSKHMLTPIARLSAATKHLGHRRFNTRIEVTSGDELGKLAANFNEMAERLESYERNQNQWLADISHELRTPLSVLICEIESQREGIRKSDKDLLLSLSNEAKHLAKLVDDIHDISLIEAGEFTLKKKLVKPLPVLGQEVHVFQKYFHRNSITMQFELEPDAHDMQISGDATRLKQLFSNILENAVRYTKKPGRLTIRQTHTANHMRFTFEDSGPGVPEEALPFLFNRLYRVDSSRSRKTGGNGLGLAICKSIVEMHNGSIKAKNSRDGGLIIDITLPLEQGADDLKEALGTGPSA
jgi:two-component system sensor histidine kinase BaeS